MFTQNLKLKERKSLEGQLTEGKEWKKQREEGQNQQGASEKRNDLMMVESSTIQDVLSLREKVCTLSKISLQLSIKVMEQQEKIAQSSEISERANSKLSVLTLQNKTLKNQLNSLKNHQSQLEKELLIYQNKFKPSEIEPEQISISLSPLDNQLQSQRSYFLSRVQQLTSQVDSLSAQLEEKKLQISNLSQVSPELLTFKQKCKEISDRLYQTQQELKLKRQENLQLIKKLKSHEKQDDSSEELKEERIRSSREILQADLAYQKRDLSELKKKHKILKTNYDQLRIEHNYIKERYELSQTQEKDLDHAVIDRFIMSMRVFRDKIQQKQKTPFMDIKKKAFFSRLEKEYNKLLVEK